MTEKPTLPWNSSYPHIDCGEGWYDLIRRLDADLHRIDPTYRVVQVKEKFGELRYYVHSTTEDQETNDAVHARIAEAEEESRQTCEVCSEPGSIRPGGWLRCLCDEHATPGGTDGSGDWMGGPAG